MHGAAEHLRAARRIQTPEGRVSFDEVAGALAAALEKTTADAARAVELTGAIQNEGVVERIEKARALGLPVLADSKPLVHPQFENARVRTPLLLSAQAGNPAIGQEWFGPIAFVVATDSTEHSIQLARDSVIRHGALSLSATPPTTPSPSASRTRPKCRACRCR